MFHFKPDPLIFLDTHLKPALAATAFIFLAKQSLQKEIFDEAVEKMIQAYTEKEALRLGINPEELKKFMDHYCQLSRDIQTQLKNKGTLTYSLSADEKNALENLKQKFPNEFAGANTLEEIQTLLHNNSDYSTKMLSWGRGLIAETNGEIFKAIKATKTDIENTECIFSADTVLKALNRIYERVFINLELNTSLTLEMAKAIAACTGVEQSSEKIYSL
ncbi:MAG: hypothetical protein H0U57_13075 [Tatlockia sp.]|nr:hypothetical protein [Tatlockia sp.]